MFVIQVARYATENSLDIVYRAANDAPLPPVDGMPGEWALFHQLLQECGYVRMPEEALSNERFQEGEVLAVNYLGLTADDVLLPWEFWEPDPAAPANPLLALNGALALHDFHQLLLGGFNLTDDNYVDE